MTANDFRDGPDGARSRAAQTAPITKGRAETNKRDSTATEGEVMRKWFEIGGLIAAVVLIAFGITAIVMGVNGRDTVRDNLAAEQIYFGDAKTDDAVPAKYSGQLVNTGAEARAFAQVMRHHTLAATKDLTYAEMGRFAAKEGTPAKLTDGNGGTNDEKYAAIDPTTNQPVSNGARNIWVTETALTTALNTAYMAEKLAVFGMVVGIALLLAGIGFGVLAIGGALRNQETALKGFSKRAAKPGTVVPSA
jgi:hypothetical protein